MDKLHDKEFKVKEFFNESEDLGNFINIYLDKFKKNLWMNQNLEGLKTNIDHVTKFFKDFKEILIDNNPLLEEVDYENALNQFSELWKNFLKITRRESVKR